MERKQYGGLDWARLFAALLVVAIHTSPLASYCVEGDWFFTRVLARLAVPLFFAISGFFLLPDLIYGTKLSAREQKRITVFICRTGALYLLAVLIYLPVGVYGGIYQNCSFGDWLRLLLIDGTFYHLWYLPAVLTAFLLLLGLRSYLTAAPITIIVLLFYLVGLLGDSYYGLTEQIPWLLAFYRGLFQICSYTRNGFFFAPLFLLLGARMGKEARYRHSRQQCTVLVSNLAVSFFLLFVEAWLLWKSHWPRHDSMYFLLPVVLYWLMLLLLQWQAKAPKLLRPMSSAAYILHPLVIVLVRGFSKISGCTEILVDDSLIHYLVVCVLTMVCSLLWLQVWQWIKGRMVSSRMKTTVTESRRTGERSQ